MSLRAILEILVHLESFRNVDLFHQGIYCLKVSLYHEDKQQQNIPAQPYSITSVQQSKRKRNIQYDHHNLIPCYVEDLDNTMISKAFLVRYCEEEIQLNDVCNFRAEIEVNQNYLHTTLFLEVDLLFADLIDLGGPDKWQQHAEDIQNKIEFKSLSTQKFALNKPLFGIHEFLQIVFDENHFCVCNGMIHTALIDYRFRPKQFITLQNEELQKHSKEKKKKQELQNLKKPETLAGFLFGDQNGNVSAELNDQQINKTHSDFINVLIGVYERLQNTLNQFYERCMNSKAKEELKIDFNIPPLILPGQEELQQQLQQSNESMETNASSSLNGQEEQIQINQYQPIQFSQRIKSNKSDDVANEMIQEINKIASQLFYI